MLVIDVRASVLIWCYGFCLIKGTLCYVFGKFNNLAPLVRLQTNAAAIVMCNNENHTATN